MSYERTPGSLLIPERTQPYIDEELRQTLQHATEVTQDSASFLNYLMPDSDQFEAAKQQAIKTGNPDDYDAVTAISPAEAPPYSYETRQDRLNEFRRNLKDAIRGQESDDSEEAIVTQLYAWKVNELIAEYRLMHAIYEGNERDTHGLNRFIYGMPNKDIHAATVSYFRNAAEAAYDHPTPAARKAAKQVLRMLPEIEGNTRILTPNTVVFERVRQEHFNKLGFYPLLFSGVELPEKGPVRPDVGEPIIEQAMDNVGLANFERNKSKGASWSTDNDRQQVAGPEQYAMPLNRFIGLPNGHEIGSHGLEFSNGLRTKLYLSSQGFDRYDRGNEGRAVIREQVPYKTFNDFAKTRRWQDIMRRHLAVSFSAGLWPEETTTKDFVTTIGAIDRVHEQVHGNKDATVNKRTQKAEERTWKLVERVLNRKIYKDQYYLEYNIACWKNAERIASGDLGKFDITNIRHTGALERLGIL